MSLLRRVIHVANIPHSVPYLQSGVCLCVSGTRTKRREDHSVPPEASPCSHWSKGNPFVLALTTASHEWKPNIPHEEKHDRTNGYFGIKSVLSHGSDCRDWIFSNTMIDYHMYLHDILLKHTLSNSTSSTSSSWRKKNPEPTLELD